ncbi:MAG: oligosaccharide flippase family protein [Bacteroidia bacterium]|nr:oligosaccharide flippase family protein [Bacteroidia bacterium]
MSYLKKLASQTVIYGLSTIAGRFINFLLVPLYTACFNPQQYGIVTDLYAISAFFNILLVYGMETAFFNFTRLNEYKYSSVFSTALNSLLISTLTFLIIGSVFQNQISFFLGYENHSFYILCFIWILGIDALCTLPFALLRQQEKALKFSIIKLVNIGSNVMFNLYFLVFAPQLISKGINTPFYYKDIGVGYIFISNLAASIITAILLLPEFIKYGIKVEKSLRTEMLKYAWPLIFIGLAGMANETFDRAILKYLTPQNDKLYEVGVYGAFYKLSMIMTIFVQAFRYAAEPFFFNRHKNEDSKVVYARVLDYFVITCCFIFIITMLFVQDISSVIIRKTEYFTHPDGMTIVPILLMANLFLGIYYSISVWYRLTDNTRKGSLISIVAAIFTVVLNIIFIPIYGFVAAAWVTLAVYIFLAVVNYIIGQKYFKVPYNLPKIFLFLFISLVTYYFAESIKSKIQINHYLFNFIIIIVFSILIYITEFKFYKNYYANRN